MSGGFRFVDDVDAQRQLGVDRLTFEQLIREGRLKPVSKMGGHSFFRLGDLTKLRDELHPESAAEDAAAAPPTPAAIAPDAGPPPADGPAPTPKRRQDPAMRVHLRLTADLKWYDISDGDLQAWFNQTTSEAYDRYRSNAHFVIGQMEKILRLLDDGEARQG